MAYVGVQLSVAVLWAVMADASPFAKLECKTDAIAHVGQQTTLECIVQATQSDIEIRLVTWKKDGKNLLVFHNDDLDPEAGFQFAEPSWNHSNRNVSLLITKTGVVHGGVYECDVMTNRGDDTKEITLSVTAKYSKPTIRSVPKTIDPNAEATLICSSSGGYPKGQLRWFDVDSYEWTKSAEMNVTQTDVGLYKLTSKLQLGSILSKYTCVVFNASGSKVGEATFDVPPASSGLGGDKDSKTNSTVVAPLVVIGSLIVGLLILTVVCWRRRMRGDPQPSLARTDEDEQLEDQLHPDNHV